MKAKTRFIPAACNENIVNEYCAVYYSNETKTAIAYKGNSSKSAFYYKFSTIDMMMQHINSFIDNTVAAFKKKQEQKADQAAANANINAADHYKVGDIIYSSWGWEQTNINFYQVVEVKQKTVIVEEIENRISKIGSLDMHGDATPVINSFKENSSAERNRISLRLKADFEGELRLRSSEKYICYYK